MPNDGDYSPPLYREWQCPPAAAREDIKTGWLNESTQEGMAWLKSQRGYSDFRKSLDVLSGRDGGRAPAEYRSKLNPNPLKRNIREIVGTLAKLRPFWGYHSDNKAYAASAEMMNKVTRAWYLEVMADRSIKEALCWAAATNRGWVVPVYSRDLVGTGEGNILLESYGSESVLPVQLPASGNFQKAYAVTIMKEMPIFMAHGMFPTFQDRLRPTNSRYWYMNDGVRRASQGNILQRIFGRGQTRSDSQLMSDLLIPIRYTYIIDLTINKTGKQIPMGEPGASWSYTVPYVGQRIAKGNDPSTGALRYEPANETDARLYPYRRLIISTDTVCLYDGPGFDWHGKFPGVSFCLDEWPWEPLGFSLVHDGYEINEAIKQLYRGNMDKAAAMLDMSLAFDTNAVSSREAKAFDPMQPRGRIGYDGQALEGQPFQPVVPPEVLKIDAETIAFAEALEQKLSAQQALNEVMALAKMRAVGSMDDIEKIAEMMGPIVEDMSRGMEPPLRDLGTMIKYDVLQYFTTSRVMQYVGADNISQEIFDYDPASLVPSHIPGENADDKSPTAPAKRARIFADNLRFFILPNSMHEITQMAMRLGLIQLKKAGVMIDSQTVAEAWSVPNYGSIDGNTVIERYMEEQEMQLRMAARMKDEAAGLGLTPPGGAAPGKSPEGRPPTGQAAPQLKSKDNGTRSTISESK